MSSITSCLERGDNLGFSPFKEVDGACIVNIKIIWKFGIIIYFFRKIYTSISLPQVGRRLVECDSCAAEMNRFKDPG